MTPTLGVYDRYWSTGGGAERVSAAFAAALVQRGTVALLGHEPIDIGWLEDRFGVDLAGVETVVLPDRVGALAAHSESLDVLVNASFMSAEKNRAARGLYYVHFPTPLEPPAHPVAAMVRRGARRLRGSVPAMEWGEGFHHRDSGSRAPIWSDGRGLLRFSAAPGEAFTVRLVFSNHRPPSTLPAPVRIVSDGEVLAEFELAGAADPVRRRLGRAVDVELVGRAEGPVEVCIESDSFVPADIDGGADRRRLGVPLSSVVVGGGAADHLARVAPTFFHPPTSAAWLETYQAVVANSEFTRHWVERYWKTEAGVLYPPVPQFDPGPKQQVIASVGRFFGQEMGHSKRQLEMVRVFATLVDDPAMQGWRLVLAGGCDESATEYLDEVRAAAAGLPVDFRVNAPFSELRELYASASIYWHAAGLGVDPERHPDRLEHFGIVTGEAMSAGAVPIVVDLAGQREIVRHGVDGYRFRTEDDLAALTRHLIANPGALRRMSQSARSRAASFGPEAFQHRVAEVLDEIDPA